MVEEKISQEFRFKNIDEIRNYFRKGIEQVTSKHKKVCTTLSFYWTLSFTLTAFSSLLDISIGITSSVIGLKIRAIAAWIKKA